jgi:hypothetical protein
VGRPDSKSAGRSALVPFKPGEAAMDRHDRRRKTNLERLQEVQDRCDKLGITLVLKNDGHHWVFTREKLRAEWWPSSAKLVFDQKWNNGVHAHDYTQVLAIIERRWAPAIK